MPKATIEKAVKDAKGEKGELDSEFLWEVRGPGRAAVLVEVLAKSRATIPVRRPWMLIRVGKVEHILKNTGTGCCRVN